MTKMEAEFLRTRTYWTVTAFGDVLGSSYTNDSYSVAQLTKPGTLPTEASARRVNRAFKKWMDDRFPGREMPNGGQYFMAFADGAIKVGKAWKSESEATRKKYGNCWKDQGDAHRAAEALAWLCAKERELFELRHNDRAEGEQERLPGAS